MALPAFHSFGFIGGIVLPLISGVPTFFYPSPLHYRTVPELVYGICATYLFGTDTFLAGYARMANPYDFRSLRYIIAGAEPIKETDPPHLSGKIRPAHPRRLRRDRDLAGARRSIRRCSTSSAPSAGCCPACRRGRRRSRAWTRAPAAVRPRPQRDARLSARGQTRRARAAAEGWYDTGDIVSIDEQGYVAIKGRAKRFAKIGGEMISLAAVEMLAAELWPSYNSAVVAVPDARKGERLVLVTDKHTATRADFQAYARSKHAAELMLPSEVLVRRQAAAPRHRQAGSADAAENGARAGGGQGDRGGVNSICQQLRNRGRCPALQRSRPLAI